MGKWTRDWIKFKRMSDEGFVVAGYIQKGQHSYSLILGKYRNGALIYKGHVTSGVTRDTVEMPPFSGRNPFSLLPVGNENAVWVKKKF